MNHEIVDIRAWMNDCINGSGGLRSFYKYENLGNEPEDWAVAGAEWILNCLTQPHGRAVLDAVNTQAANVLEREGSR